MNLNNNISSQKAKVALLQLSQAGQKLQEDVREAANFATPPDSGNEATLMNTFCPMLLFLIKLTLTKRWNNFLVSIMNSSFAFSMLLNLWYDSLCV